MERRSLARRLLNMACGVLLAAAAGCDTAPIYTEHDRDRAIGKVPDRARWQATGTVSDAPKAIDGNVNTAAVAGNGVESPSLMIDLGKEAILNMVVLDHGRNEFGFARQVAVSTSVDGRRFIRRHTSPGTRRVSSLLLVSPVLARYIRLDVIVPGTSPWSVGEVHVQ